MRRVSEWTMVALLCWAAGAAAGEERPDPRLQEAQAAYDEAKRLYEAGKYADAIPKGEHALTLREAALGSTHPEVAKSLNQLGVLHDSAGDPTGAEPFFQRALAIREAAFGTDHPAVAMVLDNLAVAYVTHGLYDRAEPLYQRALAIREAALGRDHPDVADSLNNLARLYSKQGLYGRAEPLYQRAIAICEAAGGKNHPGGAASLENLANLYTDQGLYDRAEPLYQRALAIDEAALGKNHPDVAQDLNDFAHLYAEQGMFDRAAPLYERALAIREAALGEKHPAFAESLHNLATQYEEQGLYDRVEPLFKRALAIREAALGKDHPFVASSLDHLATHYRIRGLYDRAAPLYERALAINEAALGRNHPDVARSLNDLALLRLAQHRLAEAVALSTRAFALSEQRLRQEALEFSGSRLASFLQYLRTDEERLYALLRAHPDNADVRRLALTAALLLKGRSVEETADTSRTIYRSLSARDRETFEQLRGLRTRLATLSLQGPGPLPPADYPKQLKELADRGDALEADLARRSAPLRALTALPPPGEIVDRVAAALPKDGALVELVAYVDSPLVPPPGAPPSRVPNQLRYLALVLFPDANSRAVDLGPAAPIDRAASDLRDAFSRRDADYFGSAQALYTLAFQPLLPLLGDVHRLFLAPDGQLGLVPFAALHDGRRFLIDSFDFTYLTSGKDLLPRTQDIPPSRSVVVFADPDFGAPPQVPPSPAGDAPALAERSYPVERFFSALRADLADRPWAPLPGARQEAESLQRLFPRAQLFLGPDASKERLLHLATPGILHIATHGFFLEDAAAPTGARGVGHVGTPGGGIPARRPPDPLLRSGLVLAGARAPEAKADGALVTALELAGLDLWGTELVVLSACDTGRGDVKLGQGVYGLRRALVVAGAETVVMSLWKVNDDTTRILMDAYYRDLLAGKGRAAALRDAMQVLRQTRPHPHFWAPFIALGQDGPLRALAPIPPRQSGQ